MLLVAPTVSIQGPAIAFTKCALRVRVVRMDGWMGEARLRKSFLDFFSPHTYELLAASTYSLVFNGRKSGKITAKIAVVANFNGRKK